MKILAQTQLSNYDAGGTWILECDSGWQMVLGRVREILKLRPETSVTVTGPRRAALRTQPEQVTPDVMLDKRVTYVELDLIPNALATRFDFQFDSIARALALDSQKQKLAAPFDVAYINDPMHLKNFAALFYIRGAKMPRFVVHSHFIDNPECPKFPQQASLWRGQLEAAARADWNFWQCESALNVFLDSATKFMTASEIRAIRRRSVPWDDGYSATEISAPIDETKLRFDLMTLQKMRDESAILFVPNRVGGRGRSSDYTNCGKFLFEILPKLRQKLSPDLKLTVIAGNPSQKFANEELERECGVASLVPDALNRDEVRAVMRASHVTVGLYDQDAYGGTAAREAIELGSVPAWIDNYEYASLAAAADASHLLARADMSDLADVIASLISRVKSCEPSLEAARCRLQRVVRKTCALEHTTPLAMRALMGDS